MPHASNTHSSSSSSASSSSSRTSKPTCRTSSLLQYAAVSTTSWTMFYPDLPCWLHGRHLGKDHLGTYGCWVISGFFWAEDSKASTRCALTSVWPRYHCCLGFLDLSILLHSLLSLSCLDKLDQMRINCSVRPAAMYKRRAYR